MVWVNSVIQAKEFTLYIIDSYHNTHLFTGSLSSGHLQIWSNLLCQSIGHVGPIRFLPS